MAVPDENTSSIDNSLQRRIQEGHWRGKEGNWSDQSGSEWFSPPKWLGVDPVMTRPFYLNPDIMPPSTPDPPFWENLSEWDVRNQDKLRKLPRTGVTLASDVEHGTERSGGGARPGKSVGSMGRYGDTRVAHLTPGEVVLPQVAAQKLRSQIEAIIGKGGIERHTVGSPQASVNPETGLEEHFSIGGFHPFRSSSYTGSSKRRQAASNQKQWYEKQSKKLAAQYRKQVDKLQKIMNRAMRQQDRDRRVAAKEEDAKLVRAKIENIHAQRKISKTFMEKEKGIGIATGEDIATAPLEMAGPRVTSASPRRKVSYTGSAVPTLQVGGSFRPA